MNWILSRCGFWLNRYHYDNNKQKNFDTDLIRISRNLDLPLKIRHQEHEVWCLANNLREK